MQTHYLYQAYNSILCVSCWFFPSENVRREGCSFNAFRFCGTVFHASLRTFCLLFFLAFLFYQFSDIWCIEIHDCYIVIIVLLNTSAWDLHCLVLTLLLPLSFVFICCIYTRSGYCILLFPHNLRDFTFTGGG